MFRLFSLIAAACLAALCWASARPAEAQAASSAGPAAAGPEAQPMTQGFRDDFDRLDPARWYVSDGWTNGPHQDCTWSRRAVRVQGGMLRLTHLPGGGETPHPLCGEIRTRGFLQYGLIEARIRIPLGTALPAGGWPAFWTENVLPTWANTGEWDFEWVDNGDLYTNFITGTSSNDSIADDVVDTSDGIEPVRQRIREILAEVGKMPRRRA